MELKQCPWPATVASFVLLIVPYGIETGINDRMVIRS